MWLRRTCACAAASEATATIIVHAIACRVASLNMAQSIRRIRDGQPGLLVKREHAYEEILVRVCGSGRDRVDQCVEWDARRRTGHATIDHVHQRHRPDLPATL